MLQRGGQIVPESACDFSQLGQVGQYLGYDRQRSDPVQPARGTCAVVGAKFGSSSSPVLKYKSPNRSARLGLIGFGRNVREARPVAGVIFLQGGIGTMEVGVREAKILRCTRYLEICYKSGGLVITNAAIQHHTDC